MLALAPILAAIAQTSPSPESGEVWLDVAPAHIAAAAVGNASWTWPGDEVAVLDDAGGLHLVLRDEGRVRVFTGQVDASFPARVFVADLQQRILGPEVYVVGARGDVWQAETLPSSAALKTARIEGDLPASPRAILTGEFRLSEHFAQFLVIDAEGRYGSWRIDAWGVLQRERLALDLAPATSLLLIDRSDERAFVFGRGWVDGLTLVDADGALWAPEKHPEDDPDEFMRPYAKGAGRLLCRGMPRSAESGAAWLFDQHADGRVRALVAGGAPDEADFRTVFTTNSRVVAALAPERLRHSADDRLWTLDERAVLRCSDRPAGEQTSWTTEVLREGPSPAVGLFELHLGDKHRPDETRLVVAWGSRLVELGAP